MSSHAVGTFVSSFISFISSIFICPHKPSLWMTVCLHWSLCAPAVWHAAAVSRWAEAGAVPRLQGPPDNEGHREHHHHRRGEPQWNLRELPWVWGRWASCFQRNSTVINTCSYPTSGAFYSSDTFCSDIRHFKHWNMSNAHYICYETHECWWFKKCSRF